MSATFLSALIIKGRINMATFEELKTGLETALHNLEALSAEQLRKL